MKVGYVCTSYNNAPITAAAIASLYEGSRPDDVQVVVVDNNSQEHDVDALRAVAREFPRVALVLSPDNIGYFPGLNVGIGHLRTMFPDVRHLVVGNNDLVFPKDFVETVQRHRDVLDVWAVVAPDLVTLDGVHQNPHVLHPISRLRKVVWDLYYLSYAAALVIRQAARVTRPFTIREENSTSSELYKEPGPIEQGYGACYLLGPAFFTHFKELFAPTFMMQEEFFLYEQLKTIGQMMYYDPRFVVYHHGHATLKSLPSRWHWKLSAEAHRVYKRFLAMSPTEQLGAMMNTRVRS